MVRPIDRCDSLLDGWLFLTLCYFWLLPELIRLSIVFLYYYNSSCLADKQQYSSYISLCQAPLLRSIGWGGCVREGMGGRLSKQSLLVAAIIPKGKRYAID